MQRTLTNDHFTLRPLTVPDAAWLKDFWNLPEVNRNTASIPAKVDEDFVSGRIKQANEGEEAQTHIVRLNEDEGKAAGVISIKRKTPREAFYLAYAIHPDCWGKGIATQAGETLLGWSDKFAVPKFYISGHFTDNPASGAVLRKLGFLPCWRAPVFSVARDEMVDHLYMSRLF